MSKLPVRLASATLLSGALLLAALAGGCGPSTSATICEALCTCTPCTDNDVADCEDSADAAMQQSQAACAAPFADYLTCAKDNVRCRDPQALNTKCMAEITAVIRCDPTLAIIGTPCAAAPIKTAVCLETTPPTGTNQTTCVGQQECIAKCTIAATCAQVKDVFSSNPSPTGQPLLDCFSACSQPPGG
jgi:hypothetical protein